MVVLPTILVSAMVYGVWPTGSPFRKSLAPGGRLTIVVALVHASVVKQIVIAASPRDPAPGLCMSTKVIPLLVSESRAVAWSVS